MAIEAASNAVRLLDSFGPSSHLAHAHKWLSDAYQAKKDWEQARSHAESAVTISGVVGDTFTLASCRYIMALLHLRTGEGLAEGLTLSGQAHQAFVNLGVRKSAAYALDARGQIHWKLGDAAQAQECIAQSEKLLIELDDNWALVNIRMHLGDVLFGVEEVESGAAYWREAHSAAAPLSHPYAALLEERLARASLRKRRASRDDSLRL